MNKIMRTLFSWMFYWIGDLASRILQTRYFFRRDESRLGNWIAEVYNSMMTKSINLDIHSKVWKTPEGEIK